MTNRTPLTDAELEIAKVKQMARVMDAILGVTTYEIDEQCCQCGARSFRSTRDPSQAGVRTVICSKCSTGDRPASYDLPQTGW